MGPGITLLVLGAILAFAVRTDASVVDLQTVGLILMVAGAAVIGYSRRERRRTEVVTRVEQASAPAAGDTVRESVVHETIQDPDGPYQEGPYQDGLGR